jgi:hypothetical protein
MDSFHLKVKTQIISLLEQYAFIPPSLKNEHRTKILAMVLGECSLADSKRFAITDQLLNQGIDLPPSNYCKRNLFKTTREYFNALLLDPYDLYITLRNDPNIVTEQDEDGNTLLHSCKSCFKVLEKWDSDRFYNSFTSCYALLRVAPNIDYSIKNIEGNTVIHIAALRMQLVSTHELFKLFSIDTLNRAIELGFNFFDKNDEGRSVLDIVL